MPAQKNASSNPFEALFIDAETSSPQTPADAGTTVPSKRQLKKAAKVEKAKVDVAKQQAVAAATGPSSKTTTEAIADKPLGWKASLTIAQVKALNAEEKNEKHAQLHPPQTGKTLEVAAQAKEKAREGTQNVRSRFGPGAPSGPGPKGIGKGTT